ncbi:biliverdin-producing heme oxygenase [Mucilaginibacter sp. UYCu711]|uniref:biliverdin-producing heme oxygenase n=1 Tax=Mucilaginibacter sp. UYCu711 TaxID=3156339 RepID=UPI003D1F8EF2
MKNELLADQLKGRTSGAHQELEKVLVRRMRAMRGLEDYIQLLQSFYGYFGALEDRINFFIGRAELPDYLLRRKSESLAKDIISLGGKVPDKAGVDNIPMIENYLQAFGALYVMEGSTLGGQIITQMLTKQLRLQDKGLLFFSSYGEHLETMWATFKMTLNRQATSNAEAEIVILAADATFRQFKNWLEK